MGGGIRYVRTPIYKKQSRYHKTEPVDNVKSYIWHFGDGNIYSDYEAVHSYSKSGLYEVILEAVLNLEL